MILLLLVMAQCFMAGLIIAWAFDSDDKYRVRRMVQSSERTYFLQGKKWYDAYGNTYRFEDFAHETPLYESVKHIEWVRIDEEG